MTKIAFVTDTHHGVRNDNAQFYEYQGDFFANIFFPMIQQEGVEKIVYKMKMKLSEIVGGRGIGVNVDGNHNRNTMSFDFEDGSKFTVKNGIVLSYSVYGKPFYRYPTTFHNVILPNGDKLSKPSEAKIKKEFAK